MKQNVLVLTLKFAKKAGPIGAIIHDSVTEKSINVVTALKSLSDAGYKIDVKPGEHGAWVKGYDKDGALKLQGYHSAGEHEAALMAIFGALREENAAVIVGEELVKSGKKLSPEMVQKLESGYITNGIDFVKAVLR